MIFFVTEQIFFHRLKVKYLSVKSIVFEFEKLNQNE